jgi:hypothetical protein
MIKQMFVYQAAISLAPRWRGAFARPRRVAKAFV